MARSWGTPQVSDQQRKILAGAGKEQPGRSESQGAWVFKQKGKFKYPGLKAADLTRQIRAENHPLDLGIMRSLATFATGVSMMCTKLQGLKSGREMSKWKENVN